LEWTFPNKTLISARVEIYIGERGTDESSQIQELSVIRLYQKMRGKNMSKLKKRDLERKGEKKKKILENKLIEEHLVDLKKPVGELEELSLEEER
jgi:hypothetical protein